jgi:thiamine-phosphate pyrophosphorylase
MRLIRGGARLIQLRDKGASPSEFYHQAAAALRIAHTHSAKLIINDRVDVALVLKADGVHLGQSDLPVEVARSLLGKNAIIGVSTHNITQAMLAAKMAPDYIAFGPIFDTLTKHNPDPVVGLAKLRDVRANTGSLPLVAIGGINSLNAASVLGAGADAVAMIAELVARPAEIEENMRRILALAEFPPSVSSTG